MIQYKEDNQDGYNSTTHTKLNPVSKKFIKTKEKATPL